MRYNDFSSKRAFKYDELSHELRDEQPSKFKNTPAPAAPVSNEIKMTAMYYLNVDTVKAQEYVASGIKLKQDRRGSWYLPEYNKSGRIFQEQLAKLKADHAVGSISRFK